MLSKIKYLAIVAFMAFSFAGSAFAQDAGGVEIPEQPAEYMPRESSATTWDYCKGFIGGCIAAVTGVDPFAVYDSTEMVVEASESISETRDNAVEYFDTYEDAPGRPRYTLEDEDLSDKPVPWVYNAFWSLFE